MASFDLQVNGERHTVEVPPNTPLLWVLRDTLGLTGTKYGCGLGLCGSCTGHLNGRPAPSCQVSVASVEAREVRTIEGLSSDGAHPLQRARAEEDVPQCGYCQAGQLMSAAALLEDTPRASDYLCRNALLRTPRSNPIGA